MALVLFTMVSGLAGQVTYRLDVNNTWSTESHPGLFPDEAHFSWLGGGLHNREVSFWREHELASPGVKEMAETGVINTLVAEVENEVALGNAGSSLAYRWWFCPDETIHASCGPSSVEFDVSREFPLVTLATMLGPSPDWFVGVSDLSLREDGRWRESIVVDLLPFDGGTRSDNQWKLFGPENDPPETIQQITGGNTHLVGPSSLGTMTFTLVSEPPRVEAAVMGWINRAGFIVGRPQVQDAQASLWDVRSSAGLLDPVQPTDAPDPSPFATLVSNTPNQITWSEFPTELGLQDDWVTGAGYDLAGALSQGIDPCDDLSVAAADGRVRFCTIPGDVDFDGAVTFADFLKLSNNFGATVAEWPDGDFDWNAKVEFSDFLQLSANFGKPLIGIQLVSVPESGGCGVIWLGVTGLFFRRHLRGVVLGTRGL